MNRKFYVCFVSVLLGGILSAGAAKKVVIKAGTQIPLQAVNQVKAADVTEGAVVDFRTTHEVKVDGVCVLPQGLLAKGRVVEAKRSSLAGTKGRLKIQITEMNTPSGETIFFSNSQVYICGKNRTPLAVVACLFVWPCIFIPGSKAVMPAGYETMATVAANTTLMID